MTLREWLEAERGRSKLLAERFGVTPSAVSQWLTNGVPLRHMAEIRDLTGGAVSLDELIVRPPIDTPQQPEAA